IPVAEFLVEFFLAGQRPSGAGTQRVKRLLAFAVRQAPAGILAAEAGNHRIGTTDREAVWPVRARTAGGEADLAETAHADFADALPGQQATRGADPGIDQLATVTQALAGDPQP